MDRIGYVYFNGDFAGTISELSSGFRFTYDPLYQQKGTPLGYNLPLSQNSFVDSRLCPLFSNLLSEGWLRDIQCSYQHLDTSDEFGLLLNNGLDMAGAVTVQKERI